MSQRNIMDSNTFENCPFNWTDEEAMINCTDGVQEFVSFQVFEDCCIPVGKTIRIVAAVWCIIVAVFGFLGNLFTLLAVPWATRNKMAGFNSYPAKYTNIFIVNLAFGDFLYCLINLPLYSVQYLMAYWPLGHQSCRLVAAFRYVNAFAAWMAVAFVALSRCLSLTKPLLSKKLLGGNRGYLAILSIWVYATAMVLPSYLQIFGTFGYLRKVGKCDFVQSATGNPHYFFYSIGFLVPLGLMVISYYIIWKTSIKSSSYLKKFSNENKQQLDIRDHRLTRMISMVCFLYVFFVGPIAGMNIGDITIEYPNVQLICFFVYWFQYSFNFFVYALRNEQFRKAYAFFLKYVVRKITRNKGRRPHNTIFFINTQPPRLHTQRILKRASSPDLTSHKLFEDEAAMDIRVGYSLNLEMEKSILSYTGAIEVEGHRSPAIIILPGKLKSSIFTTALKGSNAKEVQETRLTVKTTKKTKKNKKNVTFHSEKDYADFCSDNDLESSKFEVKEIHTGIGRRMSI